MALKFITPQQILAALLTVDGSGSGLDADTVDGVDSGSLGGGSATETEIDFGSTPVWGAAFSVADGTALTTNKIVISQSYAAPTGKDVQDNEWDPLVLVAYVPTNGTVAIYAHAVSGPVVGKFKINYLLA